MKTLFFIYWFIGFILASSGLKHATDNTWWSAWKVIIVSAIIGLFVPIVLLLNVWTWKRQVQQAIIARNYVEYLMINKPHVIEQVTGRTIVEGETPETLAEIYAQAIIYFANHFNEIRYTLNEKGELTYDIN